MWTTRAVFNWGREDSARGGPGGISAGVSLDREHLWGNRSPLMSVPQGRQGRRVCKQAARRSRLSAHAEESLGGAYPPALTCPEPALGLPDPWGGSRDVRLVPGRAIPSRVNGNCSAACGSPRNYKLAFQTVRFNSHSVRKRFICR